MKRGPNVSKGIVLAIPHALRRGQVMIFLASLMNLAEILITGSGLFVLVRIRLSRKLSARIADIEADFRDVIDGLRTVPRFGPVSCELWLYSRYGTMRYFRIEDTSIVEIDPFGAPLVRTGTIAGIPAGGMNAPVPAEPVHPGKKVSPGISGLDPKSPIYQWLAMSIAETRGEESGKLAINKKELKKILDAGKPAGGANRKVPPRVDGTKKVPDDPEKFPDAREQPPGLVGSDANHAVPDDDSPWEPGPTREVI